MTLLRSLYENNWWLLARQSPHQMLTGGSEHLN